MVYYCTNCWKEIKKDETICPYCGTDQSILDKAAFKDKLINALNHPEPETPIRAANILAQLKVKEAVPSLIKKLEKEKDPFIIESIVRALIEIDLLGTKPHIMKICAGNPTVTIKHLIHDLEKNKTD